MARKVRLLGVVPVMKVQIGTSGAFRSPLESECDPLPLARQDFTRAMTEVQVPQYVAQQMLWRMRSPAAPGEAIHFPHLGSEFWAAEDVGLGIILFYRSETFLTAG
jgi:hypothetical protein